MNMWITALAMKTRTAETRMGSQSEVSAVIGASVYEVPALIKVYSGSALPRRVLPVEQRELLVELRPVAREHGRFGEERLAHHCEELGRVLGRVRIDEGRLPGVDVGAEALVGVLEG